MKYQQLSAEERIVIATLHKQGMNAPQIGHEIGRHRSTVWRELRRNRAPYDGGYRSARAHERAGARRKRSRRNQQFGRAELGQVEALLRERWSPEQISGTLRRSGQLSISHETIYRHVWADRRRGGGLHVHLRCASKRRRKRYGRNDSRGRLAGKRHISERPTGVEGRRRQGHWEIDTVLGNTSGCVVTLVERKTGYLLVGKLKARTVAELNRATIELIKRHPGAFRTITSDNGTEFHGYEEIERATGVKFYFATPHHSWERGTNENTNGLLRQYLPKRTSFNLLTQNRCDLIAQHLNQRPRKDMVTKHPMNALLPNCYSCTSKLMSRLTTRVFVVSQFLPGSALSSPSHCADFANFLNWRAMKRRSSGTVRSRYCLIKSSIVVSKSFSAPPS